MSDLARRPGPTARVRVIEFTEQDKISREDRVVTEEPLEIRMTWPGARARTAWVTMRTPGHDFDLAAGWAWHEGITQSAEIREVRYCTDNDLRPEQEFNVVTLELRSQPEIEPRSRLETQGTGSSACGVCGTDSVSTALSTPRRVRWQGAAPDADVVRSLPNRLREHQSVFAETGGAHAAGIADPDGALLVVREDVGRHNAVDKVTGARLLGGQQSGGAYLVTSARASFELVQKAVAAGYGSLVAVGAPSSLAVLLAERAELPLFAFTTSRRCVRFA